MKFGDFMKLYADKSEAHCVSVWELEVKTGRWLGLLPVNRIPKEYADRELEKFGVCDDYDEYDGRPCIWIAIK